SLLLVLAANVVVFWSLAAAATSGQLALDKLVTFASAAVSTSMIAFGGMSWALDSAAAPAAAVLRLQEAMDPAGALVQGDRPAAEMPAREIRFRNVTFAYPTSGEPVLAGFDLTIPAGSSLAIVGQNGAGKTTIAKLLCRLYDPQAGAIEVDVGGEAEIFDRILAATRHTTTILISHRFSTVRHADRICVLEHGKVVELGTHDRLMAAGGRYRTMFELQASRFGDESEAGAALDVLD